MARDLLSGEIRALVFPFWFYCSRMLIFMSRCEHYKRSGTVDHLIDMSVSDGRYDIPYLKALFTGDKDTVEDIEEELCLMHELAAVVCAFIAVCLQHALNSRAHADKHTSISSSH